MTQKQLSIEPLVRAYIGIGSNMADPWSQVKQAIAELDEIPECCCVKHSSLYRSRPLGPADQPAYVNAVAAVDTTLPAQRLLEGLHEIERRHGRVRTGERWGPRTLDLDLLVYGNACIASATLTVPHPGLIRRDFVLHPLYEIEPDLQVPGHGPIVGYLTACVDHGLERIGYPV
jgi:2-amino-4-hydroxy-6-hydroxymethyldihydropteridine diphosphokinase